MRHTGTFARMKLIAGLVFCAAFVVQCHGISRFQQNSEPAVQVQVLSGADAKLAKNEQMPAEERLARKDPLGFFKYCLENYNENVEDYRVTFIKQEEVGGEMSAEQVTDVRFMESPYSVDMSWTKNADPAGRVLYVDDKWTDDEGRELAWIRPAGLLGFVKVKRPIHGEEARKVARRSIDQFGFKQTLKLIIKYSELAKQRGELHLRFVGEGRIDDRSTYVFERKLPYEGEQGEYPDSLLVVHIDQEWLVPTACFSYSDESGQELLGKYILTDPEFNIGYTATDFDPDEIKF